MIRLMIACTLFVALNGCYLPTFSQRPTLVSNMHHPLSANPKTEAILLWAPQTKRTEVINYRFAVEQSLNQLLSDHALLARSAAAQRILDQAVEQYGGLYDTANGTFNRAGLALAFEQVNKYIATEMPNVTDIVYVNFKQQRVRVRDGIASWDHVKQQVASTGGTIRYTTAISIELNYILKEDRQFTETLGLDIEPAPIGSHQRYDLILKRALQPYL